MGSTKVNFVPKARVLYFDDLALNDGFRIVGRDAIYRKIQSGRHGAESMFEEATGKYWPQTTSPVERVDIEVNIKVAKPRIY